jgi:hypothetical protein
MFPSSKESLVLTSEEVHLRKRGESSGQQSPSTADPGSRATITKKRKASQHTIFQLCSPVNTTYSSQGCELHLESSYVGKVKRTRREHGLHFSVPPSTRLYNDEISGRIACCTRPLFTCFNSIYSFKCYFYITFTYLFICYLFIIPI